MNQPTIVQQLRDSVKLVKPELLADVPDDYNPRQVFNYLRHKATNYEFLLEEHREKYGNVTPAEIKALTQGAADVIIEALRVENVALMRGRANTRFARFARAISQLLGLNLDAELVDLEAIRQATKTLKASQAMYKSWNERYRRQKEMVLKVTKGIDPEIRHQIEAIYSANSKDKLDKLQQEFFNG